MKGTWPRSVGRGGGQRLERCSRREACFALLAPQLSLLAPGQARAPAQRGGGGLTRRAPPPGPCQPLHGARVLGDTMLERGDGAEGERGAGRRQAESCRATPQTSRRPGAGAPGGPWAPVPRRALVALPGPAPLPSLRERLPLINSNENLRHNLFNNSHFFRFPDRRNSYTACRE